MCFLGTSISERRSWQDYIRTLSSQFQECCIGFLNQNLHDGHEKNFCLPRKRMISIIVRIMALHFFRSLSIIRCIPSSTVWWMWSRSASSYPLLKHSRWTLEFSWSNKQTKKDLDARKFWKVWKQIKKIFMIDIPCKRSNISIFPESIFEYTNHDLRNFQPFLSVL